VGAMIENPELYWAVTPKMTGPNIGKLPRSWFAMCSPSIRKLSRPCLAKILTCMA